MRSRLFRMAMVLMLGLGLLIPLANANASPPPALAQYFPETGQSAVNYYWQFWKNTPNALRVLGYPISAPFLQESFTEPGKFFMVQYFERAILEEHPENFNSPSNGNKFFVLGRLLGKELAKGRENEAPFKPVANPSNGTTWFPETQHTMQNAPGPFATFWNKYGGLPVFGYPISEQFQERNPDTGEVYWVQYFERNRFEYHPNESAEFQVLLGLLGKQYYNEHKNEPRLKVKEWFFRFHQPDEVLPEDFVYGFNVQAFYQDRPRLYQLVKNAEFGWIRQQAPWQDLQAADGTIYWGELDKVVNDASASGVKVLLSVVRAPTWATENGTHGMPSRNNFAKFGDFMRQMAEHYKGKVQAYEIWNEQNYALENGGTVAPASYYVDMLEFAYKGIKSADPNAIVVSGSPTPTGTNRTDIAVDELIYFDNMFRIQKFWNNVDVIGAHFGGTYNPPDTKWPGNPGPGPGWRDNSEFYWRRIEDVRAVVTRNGHGDRQIWVTEIGWATANTTPGYEYGNANTLDEQAQYLERAMQMARHDYAPWVGAKFRFQTNIAPTQGA
jgi:polysaccharide biosynthesis protein PslG